MGVAALSIVRVADEYVGRCEPRRVLRPAPSSRCLLAGEAALVVLELGGFGEISFSRSPHTDARDLIERHARDVVSLCRTNYRGNSGRNLKQEWLVRHGSWALRHKDVLYWVLDEHSLKAKRTVLYDKNGEAFGTHPIRREVQANLRTLAANRCSDLPYVGENIQALPAHTDEDNARPVCVRNAVSLCA